MTVVMDFNMYDLTIEFETKVEDIGLVLWTNNNQTEGEFTSLCINYLYIFRAMNKILQMSPNELFIYISTSVIYSYKTNAMINFSEIFLRNKIGSEFLCGDL